MEDTIAAVSTNPSGNGGIGIVRISGGRAIEISDKIFLSKTNKKLSEVKSHTINYGHIIKTGNNNSCDIGSKNKPYEVIDEALVSVMRAPDTYTREDIVEINIHGGRFVQNKVLEEVLRLGARLAEPGEFTKRAFLNGRLDLSEAEAVIDIINADSEFALTNAELHLSGQMSEKISGIRNEILDKIAFMEAAMDDPEHIELDNTYKEHLLKEIEGFISEINDIIKTFAGGVILKDGIKTVITGKANAGKSSLLNLLTGEETAIVTDIAGTTRDVISEKVNLGGVILNLIDTAGIRETDNPVEAIGVERAKKLSKEADLILYVVDVASPPDEADLELYKFLQDKKHIVLFNKSDLNDNYAENFREFFEINSDLLSENDNRAELIEFSARTGKGLDDLTDVIKKLFSLGEIINGGGLVITNVRHRDILNKASDALEKVKEGILSGFSEDLFFIDMMDAYRFLGEILGEEVEDDLADRIFEKFCMGK